MSATLLKTMLLNVISDMDPPRLTGRPRVCMSQCVDDLLHMCKNSISWNSFRASCGSPKTVFKWFRRWVDLGVMEELWCRVKRLYSRIRTSRAHIADTSYVKSILGIDCIGPNPTDRGRNATKISAITDDKGVPICLAVRVGQRG